MPRKTKDAKPGRVTPKGGPVKRSGAGTATAAGTATGRYTAPIPTEFKVSPWWVPALLVTLLVLGVLVIILNYLGVLGGSASNVYLFLGLGLIVAGFVVSTRWH